MRLSFENSLVSNLEPLTKDGRKNCATQETWKTWTKKDDSDVVTMYDTART